MAGRTSPIVVLSVLALGACQRNDAPVPELAVMANAPVLSYGRQAEVEIAAAKEWQSAAIKLDPRVTYRLMATGQWSIGGLCGMSDADGNGVDPLCSVDHLEIGAKGSALIGRIGRTGKPFPVGSNKALKPDTEGELFLRSYDMLPGDNTGSLRVRISVEDAAAGMEPVPAHRDPI